jgi:hypothetical protein
MDVEESGIEGVIEFMYKYGVSVGQRFLVEAVGWTHWDHYNGDYDAGTDIEIIYVEPWEYPRFLPV